MACELDIRVSQDFAVERGEIRSPARHDAVDTRAHSDPHFDSDFLDVLYRELVSQPGTFLASIRTLRWDRDAFQRLTGLMHAACRVYSHRALLDRWLDEGFDFMAEFVPEWTTHAKFPRPGELSYYESAYQELRLLKKWLFSGDKPAEFRDR
jgi:hypothetical protein